MVSSWIMRSLVLVLLLLVGCNSKLAQNKATLGSGTSKMGSMAHYTQPCGEDKIWDMVKGQCVDICKGADCCQKVACPEGTVCIEGLGVCGVRIGDELYDLDYGWWTGKSAKGSKQLSTTERPVDIKIINKSSDTVFLKANYKQSALVEIYSPGEAQKLSIPENYFCPNWCPENGMPMDLDCGRPRDRVIALASGQTTISRWSGLEIINVTRYSPDSRSKTCVMKGQTLKGNYEIKVCVYQDYDPTKAKERGDVGLLLGRTKGNSSCISTILQFPTETPLEIVIE